MNIKPTPITAAVAGAIAGIVMPLVWQRVATDSMLLVVAFLAVVAFPAHALVVGFGRSEEARGPAGIDSELLKRVGAWLAASVLAAAVVQATR